MTNHAEIERHNADETQTYKKGINKFSDWTQEEFEGIMLNKDIVFNNGPVVDDAVWEGVRDINWVD